MISYFKKFLSSIERSDIAWLGLAILFGALCLGLLLFGMALTGHEGRMFTGEPQDVLDGLWYTGAFSNLGGVVWFSCAAILSFALLYRPRNWMLLSAAAALTWAMGIDDIFLLHDNIYIRFGFHQRLVYATYFLLAFALLVAALLRLRAATAIGIAMTMGFWGISVIMDLYFNKVDQAFEDGMKFIGVCVWAATWANQAYRSIGERFTQGAQVTSASAR